MITFLIRHKQGRFDLLKRCLDSIRGAKVIIGIEEPDLRILDMPHTIIKYAKKHYNLHCNDLKKEVQSGYFCFMDDDDYLRPGALEEIKPHLTGDGIICQFLRNGHKKPSDRMIRNKQISKGMIGGGCLILHSKHKFLADWKPKIAADYDWIKEVSEKVDLKFVPIVLQIAGNNGLHGK